MILQFVQIGTLGRVAVAYTCGGYQPVRSTIIGDQPMFYFEDEEYATE